MNTVQFHHKVAFFLDAENSPRFKPSQVDKAINSAISDIVLDRYHNIREKQKKYAFQTAQRLRDELGTLVKRKVGAAISAPYVLTTDISDYWITLSMKANISGDNINTIPLTYDEINIIEQDPFKRPSITEPQRIYRIESSEGIEVIFGEIGTLISGEINYLAKPIKVDIGIEISAVGQPISGGWVVIAYVDSVITLDTGSIEDIKEGESYTIGQGSESSATLYSGILFRDTVNTDMPNLMDEEIARTASSILLGNVENFRKKQSIDIDIKNPQ